MYLEMVITRNRSQNTNSSIGIFSLKPVPAIPMSRRPYGKVQLCVWPSKTVGQVDPNTFPNHKINGSK